MIFSKELTKYLPNVSRETCEKLGSYNLLLNKWNQSYNLINRSTIHESVVRHFVDSLQLMNIINPELSILDVGSGAGFPGMVLAIAGCKNITLVESNRKKCMFLQEVARQTKIKVNILCARVENISGFYQQISARAFASLSQLLTIMSNVSRETLGYFLKGENWQMEIEESYRDGWSFSYEAVPSLTHVNSCIIKVWNLKKDETC